MKIETMLVSDLAASRTPYNPRVDLKPGMPAYDKLKRSMSEFGVVQPLVFNKRTGNLVGGHQRLTILESDGVESVEVVVVDEPLEREKALNIALNNGNVAGQWDEEKLEALLSELDNHTEIDATLTMFDQPEIDKWLRRHDMFNPVGEDEQGKLDEKSKVTCPNCGEEFTPS